MAQSVRQNIQMFAAQPVAPPGVGNSVLICNHDDGGNNASGKFMECSMIVRCDGLVRKTVQLFCAANDLITGVVIQGTFFASGDRNPEWVNLTNTINAPGIFVLGLVTNTVGATQTVLEPDLNFIRICSTLSGGQVPAPQPLPRSLKAVFGGYWEGPGDYWTGCVGQFGK